MRDRPLIYAGLAVFLALFTFPLWRNFAAGATTKGPGDVLPRNAKECVAPAAYMRTSHMKLLLDWRNQAVRLNNREFVAYNGKIYNRSLTATCLEQCHGEKAQFCDRCHNGRVGEVLGQPPGRKANTEGRQMMTRKSFLQLTGAALVLTATKRVVDAASGTVHAAAVAVRPKRWGMAIDVAKCARLEGCTKCIDACNQLHNVPRFPIADTRSAGSGKCPSRMPSAPSPIRT